VTASRFAQRVEFFQNPAWQMDMADIFSIVCDGS